MRLTPHAADREYNVRAALPEAPRTFARWAESAAQVRRLRACLMDLAYGEASPERLDLFPARHDGAPLLVFIHGGYWRSLDKSDFSWLAPAWVARGVSVAVLNYGLAPHTPMPEIVRQVLRALAWLWRNGDRLGFDPDRITVSGHSAGGHLTGMALAARYDMMAPDLPRTLVKAGVAVSGLFDLEPLVQAAFLNVDLHLDVPLARALSPVRLPPASRAPLVTSVGGDESSEFHRQSRLIAEAWPEVPVTAVPMPGTHHLSVCEALADEHSPLFAAALALVRGEHPVRAAA